MMCPTLPNVGIRIWSGLLLALSSSIVVQGQSGSAPSENAAADAEAAVAASATVDKTVFVAFGDSITTGVLCPPTCSTIPNSSLFVATSAGDPWSYPAILLDLLEDRYSSQTITMLNEGNPGESAAGGANRVGDVVETHQAEVLLLLEGVNGLNTGTVSWTAASLRSIVVNAQAAGADVMIATLTPASDERPDLQAAIASLNDDIAQIASDEGIEPVVDLHGAMEGDPALLAIDGKHPSVAGYAVMAEEFFDAIVARYEPPPAATLTITKGGAGSGTVTSSPGGISCGSDCTQSYANGASVTLTATASNGSIFGSWSGASCGAVVTMTASLSCTARFHAAFFDPVITAGIGPFKAVHMDELRGRINNLRVDRWGLAPFPFSDPVLTVGATPIRAKHIEELREALDEAYSAALVSHPAYTDRPLVAGVTPIKAIHVTELRAAVFVVE